MDTLAPVALLALVVVTLVNFVRYLRAKDWNGAVTLAVAWLIGFVACWLFGQSDVGGSLVIPGMSIALRDMGFADLLLAGLVTASSASAFTEIKKAIDRTDSAVKPKLLPDATTDTVVKTERR